MQVIRSLAVTHCTCLFLLKCSFLHSVAVITQTISAMQPTPSFYCVLSCLMYTCSAYGYSPCGTRPDTCCGHSCSVNQHSGQGLRL